MAKNGITGQAKDRQKFPADGQQFTSDLRTNEEKTRGAGTHKIRHYRVGYTPADQQVRLTRDDGKEFLIQKKHWAGWAARHKLFA